MSIWPTIDKFKNQYHLAKKTAALIADDRFCLNLRYEDNKGVTTNLELPPEERMSRFMICTRPFANPEDSLYYKKILRLIIINNVISDETEKERLNSLSTKIERGPIDFQFATESYSALDLFLVFSKGEYFEEDIDAQKIISDMNKIPIVGHMACFQFHNYAYDVFKICQEMYNAIIHFEMNNKTEEIENKKSNYCCIYCKNTNQNGFNQQEHVFPESLGNTEIILKKGLVCDVCNNGVLSQLDTNLAEHDAISFLKVLYVPINTKTGKYPKAKFQNWKITKTHPRKIQLISQSGSKESFVNQSTNEQAKFTINTFGRKPFDPLLLARSLYKIALGVLCLKYGREVAIDKRYDEARNFVVGACRFFQNSILITENCTPEPNVGCSIYFLQGGGTITTVNIFGIKIMFNLEVTPAIELNEKLIELGAKCFPLNQ